MVATPSPGARLSRCQYGGLGCRCGSTPRIVRNPWTDARTRDDRGWGRALLRGRPTDPDARGSRGCRHKRPRSIGGGAWIRTGSIARARSRRLERKRSGSAVFDDRSDNNTCRVPGRTGDRHSRGRRVCPRATPTSARGACHLRRILDRWDGRDSDASRPHRSCHRDRPAHSSHLGCAPE